MARKTTENRFANAGQALVGANKETEAKELEAKTASVPKKDKVVTAKVYPETWANFTAINKAQGMVTHPACGNWTGTLVNALLYHWGRQSVEQLKEGSAAEILERRRPGIVHRLDKETSGIIITAKNRDAEEFLQKQFKDKSLQKEYICICCGKPKQRTGDIRTQIIRDPKNRHRFKAVTDTDDGKFARTLYHCIASYGNYSLIRVRLKTGRTHQIRVHMSSIHHPVLGDVIYGHRNMPSAPRLMLHSYRLTFTHPATGERMTFEAPPEKCFGL